MTVSLPTSGHTHPLFLQLHLHLHLFIFVQNLVPVMVKLRESCGYFMICVTHPARWTHTHTHSGELKWPFEIACSLCICDLHFESFPEVLKLNLSRAGPEHILNI